MSNGAAAGVLVVDDDETLLELMQAILGASGIEMTAAPSGEAGLAAARRARPALAILDVHMPGLSGYEVCRVLRAEHGEALPFMFLSGERTESFDRVAGLMLGADDYLTKPFAADELLARVRCLMRRWRGGAGRASRHAHRARARGASASGRGLGPAEIARSLVIAPKTVREAHRADPGEARPCTAAPRRSRSRTARTRGRSALIDVGRCVRCARMTLDLVTAGESHGPALVAILTGLPAGLARPRRDRRRPAPAPAGLRPQSTPAARAGRGRGARRAPARTHARHAARARRAQPRPQELGVGDEPVAARGRAVAEGDEAGDAASSRATPTSPGSSSTATTTSATR